MKHTVEGKIVDVWQREIYEGAITIENGRITGIDRHTTTRDVYIIPGFVDAHVHIESSMLTPQNFGQMAIRCGTVGIVTDPHEIANVMGAAGIDFMVENSRLSPLKIFFTIPSCVPATAFDVSGGKISSREVEALAASGGFVALSEMMNVPGVLFRDKEVMEKINIAKRYNLPIDGHAPTLTGNQLQTYAESGILTDHECVTLQEAKEKISRGMKILLREGSAAKNYTALMPLIADNPEDIMFCTDDSHPDELLSEGHINKLVKRSIAEGFNLFDVLRIAAINPVHHYKLDIGQLRIGDKADFIVVEDLTDFKTKQVYINGIEKIEANDQKPADISNINNFHHDEIEADAIKKQVEGEIKVISIVNGELITQIENYSPGQSTDNLESDVENDIAKIVYINRYNNGDPQVAFCKGFNIKEGAFASSISHDSHNIIAVGSNDSELTEAINAVIRNKGGLATRCDGLTEVLPLPIGGIMSKESGHDIARAYRHLQETIRKTGCTLKAPFMTLSFMSLVVIPEIKIGEKGLFCYSDFDWIEK